MVLIDNFFSCSETPLWFPTTFNIEKLQSCMSCTLKMTAEISGPGNIRPQDSYGLVFEESPLVTLTINGIQHNVFRSQMVFPGSHKISGRSDTYPSEVIIYFQNTKVAGKFVCLILPVEIGVGSTNEYFAKLTNEVRNDRPPLTSLLTPDTKFLSYDGASLQTRTSDNPRPRDRCDPVNDIVTFYVSLTPIVISQSDYERLYSLNGKKNAPPKPTLDAMPERLIKLVTVIDGIKLISKTNKPSDKKHGVATNAMKCYKLNTDKDIVGDRVYVDGKNKPGTSLLSDELMKSATELENPSIDTSSSVQVADIEKYIGIAIGVVLGLLLTSTIAYYVYKFIFKKYLDQQKLYKDVPSLSQFALPLPPLPGL